MIFSNLIHSFDAAIHNAIFAPHYFPEASVYYDILNMATESGFQYVSCSNGTATEDYRKYRHYCNIIFLNGQQLTEHYKDRVENSIFGTTT